MAARQASSFAGGNGGSGHAPGPDGANTRETAIYVGDLAGELADMAAAGKMEIVASLLRFAQIECQMIVSRMVQRHAAGSDQ